MASEQTQIYLDKDVARRLKIQAAIEDMPTKKLAAKIIEKYLESITTN